MNCVSWPEACSWPQAGPTASKEQEKASLSKSLLTTYSVLGWAHNGSSLCHDGLTLQWGRQTINKHKGKVVWHMRNAKEKNKAGKGVGVLRSGVCTFP